MTPRLAIHRKWGRTGSALLIVLAFVVLLTGLVVAYFTRSTTDRSVARGDAADASADLLARSALEIIVADFKQEIANAGAPTSANIVPQRSPVATAGTTPVIPNLIRRSVRADAIPFPAVASQASEVNSTTNPSINNRSISLARWNANYLIPKANTTNDLSDPIDGTPAFAGPEFWAPDWVLVTRNGPSVQTAIGNGPSALNNPVTTNSNFVIGRYAFAVYDEGGLLDLNVAGYPYPPSAATSLTTNIGRKGVIAFADLTGMRLTTSNSSTTNPVTLTKLIAWRNYATIHPTGTYPNLTAADPAATNFVNYVLVPTRDFRTVNPIVFNNRTDQAIITRKELVDLIRSSGASFNMLQFLGTFSREKNIPTFVAGVALPQRFDIGKFSLVGETVGGGQAAEVQKYFGLQWVPGTLGSAGPPVVPTVPGHWRYVGSSGSTMRDRIPAFTANPEFFQLLNYAMNRTNADDPIHIKSTLSVGAALIDQYDWNVTEPLTGSTHTYIEYNGGWATGLENFDPARPSPSPASSPFPPPFGMEPTPPPFLPGYAMTERPFRNVGEFGYAFRASDTPTPTPAVPKTLDFVTAASPDAPILDLFTYNTAPVRAGTVNLNTQNAAVLAAVLQSAITSESTSAYIGKTDPSSNRARTAYNAAIPMITNRAGGNEGTAVKAVLGRQEISRMVAATGTAVGPDEEAMEAVARALAEVSQTRTWVLLIDVIAQSGRYPPNAASLADFVVQGEKRYWLHVAIDRFTGEIIDQTLEAVSEDRD